MHNQGLRSTQWGNGAMYTVRVARYNKAFPKAAETFDYRPRLVKK